MLNVCTIMGRLVRDPELRRTGSGVAVASFTVVCDRDFSPKDGGEKETDFIDCNAWRGTGEFVAKNFSKGRMIVVSGRLQMRDWTDKEGNKRRNAEIVADSVYFGDSKKSEQGNLTFPAANSHPGSENPFAATEALIAQYQAQGAQQSTFAMLEDDDPQLPF